VSLIQFTNVSKKYIVRHNAVGSFHSSIIDRLRGSWITDEFWALRDVSFQIEKGETVGIIGANGSGKSTTLKLITRIVRPTTGRIVVDGTIASLLELGVGFHPELSGRENIYLFGSFHGLSPKEVRRQYDHIVEFSDLEDFIDQPVKHYSSGMYVRLAFSAALSVKSDILLLDEIFAVGDERFQRKCADAIGEAQRRGTTIVLVSHSLDLVAAICHRAMWIENGKLTETGASRDVGSHYLVRSYQLDDEQHRDDGQNEPAGGAVHSLMATSGKEDNGTLPTTANLADEAPLRWGSGEIQISSIRFIHEDGTVSPIFFTGQTLYLELRYICTARVENPVFGVAIYDSHDNLVSGPNTLSAKSKIDYVEGSGRLLMTIPSLPLLEGSYQLSSTIYDELQRHPYDHHERACTFHIHASELGERHGLIRLGATWRHEPDAPAREIELSGSTTTPPRR